MTVERQAMEAAGMLVPVESEQVRIYREQAEQKRTLRGKPHGLTGEEVEAADRPGMSLARYAAMKGVRSLDDYADAQRQEAIQSEAKHQSELAAEVARQADALTT